MAKKCYRCGSALRQENEAGELCSPCQKGTVEIYLGFDENGEIQLITEKDDQLDERFVEVLPVEIPGRDFVEINELADSLSKKPNYPPGSGTLTLTIPNIILQGLKRADKLK